MTFFKTEYTKLGIPKTWLRPRKSFEGKLSSDPIVVLKVVLGSFIYFHFREKKSPSCVQFVKNQTNK